MYGSVGLSLKHTGFMGSIHIAANFTKGFIVKGEEHFAKMYSLSQYCFLSEGYVMLSSVFFFIFFFNIMFCEKHIREFKLN